MSALEARIFHAEINLRRGGAGMAHERLNGTYVSAMGEEVACKGVSQCMRGSAFRQAESSSELLHEKLRCTRSHRTATDAEEEGCLR